MSFLNFPRFLAAKILDSSESYNMGAYQCTNNEELYAIRLKIFTRGTISASTKVRVEIYVDSDCLSKIAETEDISLTTGNYLGFYRLYLDTTLNMKAGQDYYFKIVPTAYTRTADTSYIGIILDYPYGVYNTAEKYPPFIPACLELYGLH